MLGSGTYGKGGNVRVAAEQFEPDAAERLFEARSTAHPKQRHDALAVRAGVRGDVVDGCLLEHVVQFGQNTPSKNSRLWWLR